MPKAKGRHKDKSLSAAWVKSVTEPGFYADGNTLYLKVDDTGAKRWVQRLLIRGKRRDIGLGSLTLVTLAEARELALENRKIARAGGDPVEAKRRSKAVMTFKEAAEAVIEMHRPSWRNKKHAQQWTNTLQTYVFPKIGALKVSEISSADVLAVLTPIWNEKAETARRVKQRLSTVMKWTVAQGWRASDPVETITLALPKQSRIHAHRKALPYNEINHCLSVIKASDAGPTTKLALEFLILNASRSGEVRNAVWSEFDLENGLWTIPGARMKAKQPHTVPLSPRAIEILSGAQKYRRDDDLIFPGTMAGKPLSDMTLSKLVKELGFDVDVHGFRTTFKTWCQEKTNVAREVSEMALAHTIKDKAEAAYARSELLDKRRDLMERWAHFIAEETGQVIKIG